LPRFRSYRAASHWGLRQRRGPHIGYQQSGARHTGQQTTCLRLQVHLFLLFTIEESPVGIIACFASNRAT
jgi:hypothetical protein